MLSHLRLTRWIEAHTGQRAGRLVGYAVRVFLGWLAQLALKPHTLLSLDSANNANIFKVETLGSKLSVLGMVILHDDNNEL